MQFSTLSGWVEKNFIQQQQQQLARYGVRREMRVKRGNAAIPKVLNRDLANKMKWRMWVLCFDANFIGLSEYSIVLKRAKEKGGVLIDSHCRVVILKSPRAHRPKIKFTPPNDRSRETTHRLKTSSLPGKTKGCTWNGIWWGCIIIQTIEPKNSVRCSFQW